MTTNAAHSPSPVPESVAPAWHTAVLVASILLLSAGQASRLASGEVPVHRMTIYAFTGATEIAFLIWIVFGLRLRKASFRALLGAFPFSVRSIIVDLGVAAVFWVGSLMVLGSCALVWAGAEAVVRHRSAWVAHGQQFVLSPSQVQTLRMLKQIAPSNGYELATWILLCLIAGFVEEVVFRGYLQRQFTVAARGRVSIGVVLSAILFGAGHAYQGARGIFLIAIFGVLFSLLAGYRRSLRAGMMAHAWQDIFTGLALALLNARHLI